MMIPWWEHSEKGVTGTDRQTDKQTDRQADGRTDGQTDRQTYEKDRETDKKTDSNFFKGNPFENVICKMLVIFFRPKYRLIWCLFFIKVHHQPKLKREIVHNSKFQYKILYQSKNNYLIHSQLHRSACRIPNESQGGAQQFLWFHIKPLHNVCANQVQQFAICTICIIYYTKYHTIQYRDHVLNRKKRYSTKYFRNISWVIYMSIISQNKISIFCVMCLLCAPCSSKQSQVQHVNFIMYVS